MTWTEHALGAVAQAGGGLTLTCTRVGSESQWQWQVLAIRSGVVASGIACSLEDAKGYATKKALIWHARQEARTCKTEGWNSKDSPPGLSVYVPSSFSAPWAFILPVDRGWFYCEWCAFGKRFSRHHSTPEKAKKSVEDAMLAFAKLRSGWQIDVQEEEEE
jgi:hypothetical protein